MPGDRRPLPAGDDLRAALADLTDTPGERGGKHRRKRRHVDDYREHVLDGSDDTPLSQALLNLIQETHRSRHRLLPDEVPTVTLREDREAKDPQRLANEATQEIKAEMRRRGVREPTHYYSARERRETGEIDRTYEIGRKARKPPKRP